MDDEQDRTEQTGVVVSTTSEDLLAELGPISRIGVETELSRYPIHSLAKKGNVAIHIIKRAPSGEVELRWEVTYNSKYGPARQLAYKLDTLIINRRIDEAGRPLPNLIRLGSLREIAEQFGLGGDTSLVRRSLRQNAFTAITAKLKYRSADGAERFLEADFTRYSVVFTGEKLPSGQVADGVYIVLNEIFREVLNNAPIRPLNYEYLKALPPAPQRFYEIISTRMYGALKNHNQFARILYSEFCTYSALTRHFDYENFRVQMAKIHRPHLKSGYIAKVQYEQMADGEGGPDWMMCYTPGPRARAEYMTFARKRKQMDGKSGAPAEVFVEQGSVLESPAGAVAGVAGQHPLLDELVKRGISANRAARLLAGLGEEQAVIDQLEWGDHLISAQAQRIKSPAGFYIYLLTENVQPPPAFESSRQRRQRQEAERQEASAALERMALESAYEAYKSAAVEEFIRKGLSEREAAELTRKKRKQLAGSMRNFELLAEETASRLVWGAVTAEVRQRMQFLSFAEFSQRQGETAVRLPVEPGREAAPPAEQEISPAVRPTAGESVGAGPRAASPPGGPEDMARQRYREYCRSQAAVALDALSQAERGVRLRNARLYLLNEHPNRSYHQQLVTDERYEEFQQLSREHLLDETARTLGLPDYAVWSAR